jgi:hypothetical protein
MNHLRFLMLERRRLPPFACESVAADGSVAAGCESEATGCESGPCCGCESVAAGCIGGGCESVAADGGVAADAGESGAGGFPGITGIGFAGVVGGLNLLIRLENHPPPLDPVSVWAVWSVLAVSEFPNHENESSNNFSKNPPRFVRPLRLPLPLPFPLFLRDVIANYIHYMTYIIFINVQIYQIHNLTRLNSSSATNPPATWARM